MSYLEALVDFCREYYESEFPQEITAQAKSSLIDYLTSILWGTYSDYFPIVKNYSHVAVEGPSTVVGMPGVRKAPFEAAFMNGVMSHLMEIDDIHLGTAGLHPGVTIIPSVLALGESLGSTGKDILKAIIVGYEVAGRVGKSISPSHRYRGFHATGTLGGFGSTAACAFLKRLPRNQFINALSIASAQAGGTFAFLSGGVGVKYLHAGVAARNGILNVMYAEAGFDGPSEALEHKEGFAHAYAEEYCLEEIVKGLGETYEIMNVFRKRYFVCGHIFPALDALEAIGQARIPAGSVKLIEVFTYQAAAVLDTVSPENYAIAKFSIPYCLSSMILFGQIDDHFDSDEGMRQILELSAKVRVHLSPEYTQEFPQKRKTKVILTLDDGTLLVGNVDFPKGMPENRLNEEDVLEKLLDIAGILARGNWGQELKSELLKVGGRNNISELMEKVQEVFVLDK